MGKAKEIKLTVTKDDLKRMRKVFDTKNNGIRSTGDRMMLAQLEILIEEFDN